MSDESDPPENRWEVIIPILLLAMPIYFAFRHFGEPAKGLVAGFMVMDLALIVRIYRRWWRQLWFRATVSVLGILHAALFFLAEWPKEIQQPGILLAPIGALDLLVMAMVIISVRKFVNPSSNSQ